MPAFVPLVKKRLLISIYIQRALIVNYYGVPLFSKSVLLYMQAQNTEKSFYKLWGVGVTGFIGIFPMLD